MTTQDSTLKAAPQAPVFYLVYSLPDRATVRILLEHDRDVVFGRAIGDDVDVVVDDPRVSRRHAVVRRSTAGVAVRDLDSSNGTVVCGETLHDRERRIGPGDVFSVGPMMVVVVAASADLVVADPAMRKVVAAAQRVARRGAPVLLLGEPGVGKKVIAQHIHDCSLRADKPYVAFHCGSVSEATAEGDLFGDERTRRGLLATAHEGTLLLANIEHLSLGAQRKLRGLLGTDKKPGSSKHSGPYARLLCSSSADLRAAVDAGHFDPQLYLLIATVALHIPPLRERPLEIPVLADYLLRQSADALGIPTPSLTPDASKLLCSHLWPRNVSDLRDVMEVALALSDDHSVGPADLPASFMRTPRSAPHTTSEQKRSPSARDAQVVVQVTGDGTSFCLPPAPPVSLARRGPMRRVLLRLVAERTDRPAAAVSADELFAAGWPGEKSVGQSAEGRVRTAVWMLRRLGLHDVLVTRDDGYLLGEQCAIRVL